MTQQGDWRKTPPEPQRFFARDYKEGDLFMLSKGEYSDYGVEGLFRARRAIAATALMALFETIEKEAQERDEDKNAFHDVDAGFALARLAFLVVELGLAEELTVTEIHISGYVPEFKFESNTRQGLLKSKSTEEALK